MMQVLVFVVSRGQGEGRWTSRANDHGRNRDARFRMMSFLWVQNSVLSATNSSVALVLTGGEKVP